MKISSEERKKQIVDTAIQIIHTQGHHALVIREIAKQVGVTEPAIYRHFPSKEAIISGILARLLGMGNSIENKLSQLDSPKEKVEAFMRFHFQMIEKNPHITSIVFAENLFESSSLLKSKMLQVMQSRITILSRIIHLAKERACITAGETEDICLIIIGNIRALILEWKLSEFSFSLSERGERSIQLVTTLLFTPQVKDNK